VPARFRRRRSLVERTSHSIRALSQKAYPRLALRRTSDLARPWWRQSPGVSVVRNITPPAWEW
jgi:hypothetical protein